MKVHHLNCGVIQGLHSCGEHLVCHCLLIETPSSGLVLVDTGFGHQDLLNPIPRLGFFNSALFARPKKEPQYSALEQVKKLGFHPSDVRHILLTHMDLDHISGLVDFPEAQVHLHQREYEVAMKPKSFVDRNRYLPSLWAHGPKFKTYADSGERWFGFESVRPLEGLPPELLFIPTVGHTRGHSAIALETPDGWLLHAGDAYFDHREVHQEKRECEAQLEVFQLFTMANRVERAKNQDRLRALIGTQESVQVFCAHSPEELKSFQTKTI